MSIVTDFKSIARKLNRMDQKAEHDRKEAEKASQSVGWPMFGVPMTPLTSLAHPEWPYSNTPHEWRKFKI